MSTGADQKYQRFDIRINKLTSLTNHATGNTDLDREHLAQVQRWVQLLDIVSSKPLPKGFKGVEGTSVYFPSVWIEHFPDHPQADSERNFLIPLLTHGLVRRITLRNVYHVEFFSELFRINLKEHLPLDMEIWNVTGSYIDQEQSTISFHGDSVLQYLH